ncbi:hypothetical protein B0H34DRAFT_678184 [Crassisporium funariophilum]|nr:hypothetical protein B0H34DRAFT_678184 [Crassisporium funariophilum]
MTSTISPPAYTNAADFLSKVTTGNGLSAEDIKKVHTAVTDHVAEPATREVIMEELKKLAKTVMGIETDFATILLHMVQIDEKGIILDKENKVVLYAPKWEVLHQEYTALVNESQSTANKVSSRINALTTVILPILKGDYQLAQKQKSLDGYIKSLEAFQKDAEENAKRFLRLRQRVDAFRIDLKQTVSDQSTVLEAEIKVIDEKIAKLQADLDATSGFFAGCWEVLKLAGPNLAKSAGATLGAAGAVGTIAATAGLAAMAPIAGVGILIAGLGALGYSIFGGVRDRANQREAKMNEITDLKEQREQKALRLQQLKEVMEELKELDVVFDRMIDRLGAMQGIWRMLVTDSQRLHLALSNMGTTDDDLTFEFTARNVKVMYEALQLALDQYCLAVTEGGLKKK